MSRYIVRARYSEPNELNDGKTYILFERYHKKDKCWHIMRSFELTFSDFIGQYIMPVDVITFIRKLSDENYEIYYDYLSNDISKGEWIKCGI